MPKPRKHSTAAAENHNHPFPSGWPRFDCAVLFKGGRKKGGTAYAHEYDEYLGFFRMLGYARTPYLCEYVPPEWQPFVRYLGHEVVSSGASEWSSVPWLSLYDEAKIDGSFGDPRRVVEVASTTRPELVHALYLADTEWPCQLKRFMSAKREFPVTTNGSFFRPEILDYLKLLRSHAKDPKITKAILMPCAASKPYPAPSHRAVMDRIARMPDASAWQIIVATGVLGLVPQDLWQDAPEYDSGLPNLDRVTQTVAWYFTRHRYERVIVFSDFYAYAIKQGMDRVPDPVRVLPPAPVGEVRASPRHDAFFRVPMSKEVTYLFGNHYRDTYENTMLVEHLDRLELEMRRS